MKYVLDYGIEVDIEAYYQVDYDRDDWFTERMMVFEVEAAALRRVFNYTLQQRFDQLFGVER